MNYTQKHHLPQWEESDRVMRTDFNQMCVDIESAFEEADAKAQKLAAEDKKLAKQIAAAYSPAQKPYATGGYTGNGGEVTITLGFRPSFVIVSGNKDGVDGLAVENYSVYCAITAGSAVHRRVQFTDTGFIIRPQNSTYYRYPDLSEDGRQYDYIAFQ